MLKKSLVPLLVLLSIAGCSATDRGSVALTSLCYPPKPSDGACQYSNTCDPVLADGRFWVDLVTSGGTLRGGVGVQNLRPDNGDGALRTSTNTATIERIELKYEAPGLNISDAWVNEVHAVAAGVSTVAEMLLIPTAVGQALVAALPSGKTDIVIHVRAHGHYFDGTSFETDWLPVPVEVSAGLIGPYVCKDPTQKATICPQDGQTAQVTCQ